MLELFLLAQQPEVPCIHIKEVIQVVREAKNVSKKEKRRIIHRIEISSSCKNS